MGHFLTSGLFFPADWMEDLVEKNCIDLRTVGKLQVDDRLDTTREFMTIYHPTILRGAWRKYEGDDRERAVVAICRSVQTLAVISGLILESKQPENPAGINLLKKIRLTFIGAKNGLGNFCATYSDPNVDAKILPTIDVMEKCIISINTALVSAGECEIVVK